MGNHTFFRSFKELSRMYESWGRNFDHGTSERDQIQKVGGGSFDPIDSGSLLRIASATEKIRDILISIHSQQKPSPKPSRSSASDDMIRRLTIFSAAERLSATAKALAGKLLMDLEPTLTVRVLNVLEGEFGATTLTVGQLLTLSADDLLQMRNFGQTSLQTVRECLAANGLVLRDDPPLGKP